MFTISFDHSTDFSEAFDKFRRALTITPTFMFGCSYLHSSELHAQVFDKLLRALTASELVAWITTEKRAFSGEFFDEKTRFSVEKMIFRWKRS